MDKAEKKVRKEALKPKKKRRVKKDDTKARSPSYKWIKHEWGNQGEVFFDGYRYWGVFLKPNGTVVSRYWSVEKWEERKKRENAAPNSETTETEKPLLSTPKIMKSTKVSKRVPKGKSPMKRGKTVTHVTQGK